MVYSVKTGFNTTLVQLKEVFLLILNQLSHKFQYHSGPIKRPSGPSRP